MILKDLLQEILNEFSSLRLVNRFISQLSILFPTLPSEKPVKIANFVSLSFVVDQRTFEIHFKFEVEFELCTSPFKKATQKIGNFK